MGIWDWVKLGKHNFISILSVCVISEILVYPRSPQQSTYNASWLFKNDSIYRNMPVDHKN